ncbi:MAG: Ig domain-containing protein, partial [Verrucomicrobia bacterium]|nr:Ig domain-containing protein [Verrucomicrobiota bacterium]
DSTGTVAATVSQTASGSFIHPASLTISTASTLPGSLVNAAYSQSFTATSGTEPYTWTLSAGSLPADCVLSTAGVLSGVPTLTGSSSFTLQVQDGAAVTVSKAFTVTIAGTAPSITTLTLPLAVKTAAYAQTLTATDGTTPYSWSLSAGALPSGMTLSSTGVLSGTPTVSGVFNFTVKVTDGANIQAKQSYSLTVAASYSVPVMAAVSLGSTTVGQSYTATVSASNYPKTFTLTGLPAGLTYSKTAGIITGRASVTGVFNVQIKASNSAGTSAVVSAALVVKALDPGLIGSYTGIISRSVSANSNLGGLLALTLTTQGTFTAKINAAGKSTSVKGYLNAAAPQVQVTVGSAVLSLTLAGADTATGTHGTAAVTAWRHAWNTTTNPASAHAGYYTLSIDLQSGTDLGVSSIPQGSSYATLSVLASGAIKISGKTADGQSITSAGFMGAAGECALHTSLYANLGSISGLLNVQSGSSGDFSLNAVTGQITWSKPVSTTRTYAAAFGPLNLAAAGLYLAPAASGSVILGLPSTGSAALTFMEGGLALATTDPDVNAFTYSDTNVVTMPTAGSIANPAKATLSLNKNTGAMKGKFTLVDSGASRSVSFSGLIVRQLSGQVLAKGYFLLPQIPVGSEKASTSPILSGGVQISQ